MGRVERSRRPLPSEGDLSEIPMAELVHELHAGQATGALRLWLGTVEKTVFLLDGRPVSVDSDLRSETLGASLVAAGRLSAEDHRLIVERMRQTGRQQGELLIEAGLLGPNELYGVLTEHQTEKVVSCFAWTEGAFALEPGRAWAGGLLALPMDPVRIVLEGVARHHDEARLAPPAGLPGPARPFVRPALAAAGPGLRLGPREARIRRAVERGASLEAIEAGEAGDRLAVYRLLHALFVMEMVGFDVPERERAPAGRPAAAARPAAPPVAPGPGAAAAAATAGPERERARAAALESELRFGEARAALEAGEPWLAVARLREALALKKGEPQYEAWLGWALFVTDPGGNRKDAERHLEVARRAAPSLAEPYLFMARMLEHDGEGERAGELYRKAAGLAPRDVETGREAHLFALRLRKGKLRKGALPAAKGGEPRAVPGEPGSLLRRLLTKR